MGKTLSSMRRPLDGATDQDSLATVEAVGTSRGKEGCDKSAGLSWIL